MADTGPYCYARRSLDERGLAMILDPKDYPALTGEVVTQAHANYCAQNGHAVHTKDGVPQLICPRCGDTRVYDFSIKTDRDLGNQIKASLEGNVQDFDVDAIRTEIVVRYGVVDIDRIPDNEYWGIVQRNIKWGNS
jgi:hypothetical protein